MMPASVSDFINELRTTDIGKAIFRDRAAKTRTARQVLLDELTTLQAERPQTAAAHDRTLQPLRKAADASRAKADADAAKFLAAAQVKALALGTIDAKITRLTTQMIASADPKIDAARHALQPRYDRERHTIRRSEEVRTRDLTRGNGSSARVIGNDRAIRRLLAAMVDARVAFDRLKLANPEDIDEAIAEILKPVDAAWDSLDQLDEPIPAA